MLVVDPENNPYSFPALEYMAESPALVHIIQSISAHHEQYFSRAIVTAFEERGKALLLLRKELEQQPRTGSQASLLLTMMLLAMSHGVDCDMADFGKQHLFAARGLVNKMLGDVSHFEEHGMRT